LIQKIINPYQKSWSEAKKGTDENEETENGSLHSEIVPGFIDTDIIAEREELKRRLREKVNALRAKRNAPPLSDDPENKSIEPPAKRRKVEERRKEKFKTKENKKPKQATPSPASKPKNLKASDDATIEFATFDFSSGAPVPSYLQNKKKPSKSFLLKQVQEKKRKLVELQGTEEGEALAKQDAWASMKKKAQGEKVKNDAEKLKKSIKREQHQKKKSKKEWDQRTSTQKRAQVAAQKKRSENIQASKDRKRDKRLGIKRKKSIPKKRRGFEGEKKKNI